MKRYISLISIILTFLPIGFNRQQSESGTVHDIDGNVYKTVKIGNQWWMDGSLKENARGIAPDGWHIPSAQDWEKLVKVLGGEDKVANKIKVGGSTGFNAYLSGGADFNGRYVYFDEYAMFWSSTAANEERAYHTGISQNNKWDKFAAKKDGRIHIRCIKDN